MPLATNNGSIIVKDGRLAESCACCGDNKWYCDGGVCASCVSGSYPSAIYTSITMAVNDGEVTFPAKLVLFSTLDQGIGVCAEYVFSVGALANPRSVGYSNQSAPVITFTFQDIGPPIQLTRQISMGLSLKFGGACFQAFGGAAVTPNQFSIAFSDLRQASFLTELQFDVAQFVGPQFISSSSPMCYADWTGVSALPMSAGTAFKKYGGNLSLSVLSVE